MLFKARIGGELMGRFFNFCTIFHFSHNRPTIYALSSGLNSAIAVVRVSGVESYKVLSLITSTPQIPLPSKNDLLTKFGVQPRQMMLRSIFGSRGIIDRCLMVYFQSQKSYSGQDMFQLHLHGSRPVILAVFQELSQLKFVPAGRGEFTRRAIENGRMGILQAEAIDDLIHSQLEFERQVAIGNLMGKGAKYLQQLRKDLINVKGIVEGFIQFDEQEVGSHLHNHAKTQTQSILQQLQKVIEASRMLQKAKDGVKVAIVGRPNVGKSTLINGLVKREVAIVSEIPGTTRDLIESSFQIGGYRIEIVDTAGIRQSQCPIERQGMRRSKTAIQDSMITLIVIDISQSNIEKDTNNGIIIRPHPEEQILLRTQKGVVVINKIDTLSQGDQEKKIQILLQNGEIIDPNLCLSAKQPTSIQVLTDSLGNLINTRFNLYGGSHSQLYFTRTRYLSALQACRVSLQQFIQCPLADLGSHHLSEAIERVEEVIGRVDNEELLDHIFSSFCIGK